MDQQLGAGNRDGSDTLPPGEQDYTRHQVARNIKKTVPTTKSKSYTKRHRNEKKRKNNHETNRKQIN